jgi:hypothetical protein
LSFGTRSGCWDRTLWFKYELHCWQIKNSLIHLKNQVQTVILPVQNVRLQLQSHATNLEKYNCHARPKGVRKHAPLEARAQVVKPLHQLGMTVHHAGSMHPLWISFLMWRRGDEF